MCNLCRFQKCCLWRLPQPHTSGASQHTHTLNKCVKMLVRKSEIYHQLALMYIVTGLHHDLQDIFLIKDRIDSETRMFYADTVRINVSQPRTGSQRSMPIRHSIPDPVQNPDKLSDIRCRNNAMRTYSQLSPHRSPLIEREMLEKVVVFVVTLHFHSSTNPVGIR